MGTLAKNWLRSLLKNKLLYCPVSKLYQLRFNVINTTKQIKITLVWFLSKEHQQQLSSLKAIIWFSKPFFDTNKLKLRFTQPCIHVHNALFYRTSNIVFHWCNRVLNVLLFDIYSTLILMDNHEPCDLSPDNGNKVRHYLTGNSEQCDHFCCMCSINFRSFLLVLGNLF